MGWVHTGVSANINYYAEDGSQLFPAGKLSAEVLTDSLEKVNGKWKPRSPRIFRFWVYREDEELAGFDYEPMSELGPVLPPRTVAKLVNDFMKSWGG